MNGTSPSTVDMPTSQGSSIRRRASLKTQNATDSQKTATTNSDKFRITAHVLELKKSKIPLSASVATPPSEEDLSNEIPGAKREADDHQDDDRGDCEDAQLLAEFSHGMRWRRTERSESRYSEPVTRTGLSARSSARSGSASTSTESKNGSAARASSSAGSARALLDEVAMRVRPARVSRRSISSACLSARIDATIV